MNRNLSACAAAHHSSPCASPTLINTGGLTGRPNPTRTAAQARPGPCSGGGFTGWPNPTRPSAQVPAGEDSLAAEVEDEAHPGPQPRHQPLEAPAGVGDTTTAEKRGSGKMKRQQKAGRRRRCVGPVEDQGGWYGTCPGSNLPEGGKRIMMALMAGQTDLEMFARVETKSRPRSRPSSRSVTMPASTKPKCWRWDHT